MGNCLVTKLKGNVQNNNLQKLGKLELVFNVKVTDINNSKLIQLGTGNKVMFDKAVKVDSDTVPANTEITYDPYKAILALEAGTIKATIDKYTMTQLHSEDRGGTRPPVECTKVIGFNFMPALTIFNLGGCVMDVEGFKESTNLTQVKSLSRLTGDIGYLKDCINITRFNVTGSSTLKGDVAVLGKMNLTTLEIASTQISGDIDDFVAARLEKTPSTAGSIRIQYANAIYRVKYNGTILADLVAAGTIGQNPTLNWDAQGNITWS